MKNIIELYQRFSKYKNNTYQELYQHITPSMNLNQYKVFEDDQGTYGFVNWAYVNEKVENNFLNTGIVENWNCGNIMLHIDFIAKKNIRQIMSWLKNNSAKNLGLNQTIHWARLSNNNKIRTVMKQNTKDSWLWEV
jgi:hemolysin-activating ACP:hemolysin acyltransferase